MERLSEEGILSKLLVSFSRDGRVGPKYLGCIFRAQMERLSEEGILSKLLVSFSRDGEDGPKYVQDMIRLHGSELVERIYDTETIVYVCGDASNMARNVTETWEQLLQEHKGRLSPPTSHVLSRTDGNLANGIRWHFFTKIFSQDSFNIACVILPVSSFSASNDHCKV